MIPPPIVSGTCEPSIQASESDELLVERAQRGDLAAFSLVLSRHKEEVSRLLWRFTLNAADMEDLVQDVFLRLVRYLPAWTPRKPFLHWLRRVTVNVGRDFCRRQKTQGTWLEQDSSPALLQNIHDPGPCPAAQTSARELKQFLCQLAPDDRVLLSLHYLEGWSFSEIAETYGWPSPLMKVKAYRAKKRLRKLLENTP